MGLLGRLRPSAPPVSQRIPSVHRASVFTEKNAPSESTHAGPNPYRVSPYIPTVNEQEEGNELLWLAIGLLAVVAFAAAVVFSLRFGLITSPVVNYYRDHYLHLTQEVERQRVRNRVEL